MQKGSISFTPRELNLTNLASNSIATINDKALQKGIIIINEVSAVEKVFSLGTEGEPSTGLGLLMCKV